MAINSISSNQESFAVNSSQTPASQRIDKNTENKPVDESRNEPLVMKAGSAKELAEAKKSKEDESAEIEKAIEKINESAKNTSARFNYHKDSQKITVTIVDKDTEDVIQEFPPEKALQMVSKAWEMAGLLVDEKR